MKIVEKQRDTEEAENARIQVVMDLDITPRLLELLRHPNGKVAEQSFKIIDEIATGM